MVGVRRILLAALALLPRIEGAAQDDPGRGGREPLWSEGKLVPKWLINAVHFVDEKTGWVAGVGGRVAATSDGGRTWTEIKGEGKEEHWRGVWFHDADHGFAVGGLASPHEDFIPPKIAATQDGGRTWLDITPAPMKGKPHAAFDRIQFFSATEGLLFGDRLFATRDGGRTWTPVGNEDEIYGSVSTFISAKTGWTLRRGNLWKTADGGERWEETSALNALTEDERDHSGGLNHACFRSDSEGCVVTGWGSVFRTADGGVSWKPLGKIGPGHVRRMVLTSAVHGWAILDGSSDLGGSWILRTADGGRTWQEAYQSRRRLSHLHFLRPDVGWAVGDGIVLRFTADR